MSANQNGSLYAPGEVELPKCEPSDHTETAYFTGVNVGMEVGANLTRADVAAFVFELARLRGLDLETAGALRDGVRAMPVRYGEWGEE